MKVRYRSAITGQFISKLYAIRHPRTTVKERAGDYPWSYRRKTKLKKHLQQ